MLLLQGKTNINSQTLNQVVTRRVANRLHAAVYLRRYLIVECTAQDAVCHFDRLPCLHYTGNVPIVKVDRGLVCLCYWWSRSPSSMTGQGPPHQQKILLHEVLVGWWGQGW